MRVLLAVSIALCGCGADGSYELHWTIGCKKSAAASSRSAPQGREDRRSACQLKSIMDCSRRGLDSVEVLARGGDQDRTIFPCYSPDDGPLGRGPGLEPGATDLTVYGLSASGLRLTDPVTVPAQIPEEGLTPVEVDLPEPPQCRDGVDNDLDGVVDLFDPDCKSGTDDDESS